MHSQTLFTPMRQEADFNPSHHYYLQFMDVTEIIDLLKEKANPRYHAGMLRFGIDNENALGVKIPEVRKLAKIIKKDHELALQLWNTRIHEARILASLVADPKLVTPQLIDSWTKDFASWDICDQACGSFSAITC
ncbi:DNA alkylation repair protein [Chitinophaga tropicalis]|uniref:DNA alkylation repair protein n=1 Tax=Chitinophaga tropicalis TaxID=2683588 RepID=UPI001E5E08A2|nr:DNA alkylation repair protein [Chitinophaga tropicalis]